MSKQVFITGATGLLGSYLSRSLIKQGYKVRASKRKNSKMDLLKDIQSQIEWVEGDILDIPFLEKAIEGVDLVFHCAAIVSFSPKEQKKMMAINVEGTANIVNICLHYNIPKLIHTSSIAAIGRPEHSNLITEKTKWQESKLNTAYAKSKFQAELEVWRGHYEGLNIGIVNPSIILGAGYWDSGSCKLFKTMQNGLKYYPVGATGFVDVRDVAKAMVLVAKSDKIAERYIINGSNVPYRYLFDTMAKELNVPKPSIEVSPFLRKISWRLEKIRSFFTRKSPLITKDTALLSSLSYEYSNTKSIQDLGMEYISLEKTIKDTSLSLNQFTHSGGIHTL